MKIVHLRGMWLSLAATLLVSGCATVQGPQADSQNYQKAIQDAAVIEKSEVMPLPTIAPGKVRVVTWSKYPESYPLGKPTALKWGEVWVTRDNDVKSRCRNFLKNTVVSDTQKLLGLPANNAEKRSFITLEVDSSALFRPCANPGLQDKTCSPDFPKDVPQSHAAWYAHQSSMSYQSGSGFPWTRLGYTYNWKAGANEVGVAEFVIKKGAEVLPLNATETAAYCAP